MASFQAKIGKKRLRREKIKIILPFHSYPRRDRKFQKNGKKIQKIKKYHYVFIIRQNWFGKVGKERRMRKRENKNYSSVTFLSDA